MRLNTHQLERQGNQQTLPMVLRKFLMDVAWQIMAMIFLKVAAGNEDGLHPGQRTWNTKITCIHVNFPGDLQDLFLVAAETSMKLTSKASLL